MPRFKCPDHWTLAQRLTARLPPRGKNGCRLWLTRPGQYAQLRYKGVTYNISRLLLEQKLGRPLKPGMYACHKCNTRHCVEVSCLYEGTPKQNTADMIAAGKRHTPNLQGEQHAMAKLTVAKVKRIRTYEGKITQAHTAHLFGVSRSQVHRIWQRQSWKSVK